MLRPWMSEIISLPFFRFTPSGRTIVTWDTDRDGPMFAAGGLTEYDGTMARRTGEASVQEMIRELRKYDQERERRETKD